MKCKIQGLNTDHGLYHNVDVENKKSLSIHWHRRDLRLFENPAVEFHQRKKLPWLGVFCFDDKFLSRKDFSQHRFALFLQTLQVLQNEYQEKGGRLLVVNEAPQIAIPKIIQYFQNKKIDIHSLTFNRDYEPFARKRDLEIQHLLADLNVPIETFQDHLIFEPQSILKDDGKFYQVFTPYSKKWLHEFAKLPKPTKVKVPRQIPSLPFLKDFPYKDCLQEMIQKNSALTTIQIPELKKTTISNKLKKIKAQIKDYQKNRDFPALSATSMLSMHIKNGSITTRQILDYLGVDRNSSNPGAQTFLKEIIWREFYYSILWHRPDVEQRAFNLKYQNLKWENNMTLFNHWRNGTTGFPIIDAGMRELKTTGWMHNRVRMIVASFLTKDLLIDWRWGERHFMQTLLDGDLAANNGGWQWAASTGCDAQPYFRVFNPWLQSEKFDPEGEYIRKFVPELRDLPTKNLHKEDADRGVHYPKPIVQHSVQKMKAIMLYKKA